LLDRDALIADLARLVQERSITGDERGAAELFASHAEALGLEAAVVEHDLDALRTAARYPGEEAPRSELVGAVAVRRGADPGAPRLALCGHIDVVNEGNETWSHGPWSGATPGDGFLYGRGSVDMKAGVVAALHAMAAVDPAPRGDVVLYAVPSEEDGGLGAFAALEHDADFAACLIPEPTGFELVCAQAGALTFKGVVPGVAAHAALRLEGISAIDRYVPIHVALADLERRLNADVENPLMAQHELPYPLLVGQVHAGEWSSQVPDRLEFEGRVGVPVGTSVEDARSDFERVVHGACREAQITWTGGQFGSGSTDPDHPFARLVRDIATDELGSQPPLAGSPYGADMRLFCERGIPTVMFGTRGIERAHGVDERVAVDEVATLARILTRVCASF
jgi:acetylornithine deacetylase